MEEPQNKRAEERLCYKWPVLFARDFAEAVSEGVMTDVSSGGISFLCKADENCPQVGQELALRFSIPHSDKDDSFDMTSLSRTGQVLRVEKKSDSYCQIIVQFNEPLTFKPCYETGNNFLHSKSIEQ
jgi:hypothetical protein